MRPLIFMTLQEFIKSMPKIELHVHLEGTIQPFTLLQLSQKNHVQLPFNDLDGITKWLQFSGLEHFFEVYPQVCECVQTTEDIKFITREFLKSQHQQNILYSEVTYTASNQWYDNGISFEDQINAINQARSWAEKKLGISMGLIIDIPRQLSPQQGVEIAHEVIKYQYLGVIGLGLGGNERDYPPEIFQQAFDLIKGTKIHSVPHAGEMAGPKSIWGALNDLGANRIGHGVRCIEDSVLMDYLRKHQIPLEICPTSNICLGIYDQIQNHPIDKLIKTGLNVSINSDDPVLFNTSLTNEFQQLVKIFGYTHQILEQLTLNSVHGSFLETEQKKQLIRRMRKEFAQLAMNYK